MKTLKSLALGFTATALIGCGGSEWEQEITGTLAGLSEGAGVALIVRVNDAYDLTLTENGSFSLGWLAVGSFYSVTVKNQPTAQTCSIEGGTGKVLGFSGGNWLNWPLRISCMSSTT